MDVLFFTGVVFHWAIALCTAQSPVWEGILSGLWTQLSLSHAWPAERQNVPGTCIAANGDDDDDSASTSTAIYYYISELLT